MLRTGAKARKLDNWRRRDDPNMTLNGVRSSKGLLWPGGRKCGDDPGQQTEPAAGQASGSGLVVKASFMLHKPRGTVCSNGEPAHLASQRQDVYDLVKSKGFPPVGCVGRLDLETSGILVRAQLCVAFARACVRLPAS